MYISLDCTPEELRAIVNDLLEVEKHRKRLIGDMEQLINQQKDMMKVLKSNRVVLNCPHLVSTDKCDVNDGNDSNDRYDGYYNALCSPISTDLLDVTE